MYWAKVCSRHQGGVDKGDTVDGLRAQLENGIDSYLREGTLGKDTSKIVSVDHMVAQSFETYINKQVFPQAPSPTMTSLRRISAMAAVGELCQMDM